MDGKMLARLGAVVFVAVAVTATAIEMTRKEEAPAAWPSGRSTQAQADPLRDELIRCQSLGEAGPRDPGCLRAWASGIKVLVLAVIIGIGSTLFSEFTSGFGGQNPSIDEAMAIVLAALSLLGLGIFGPGIASGIVSGGPQLSAGAAVGTGLAAGGMVAAGVGAVGAAASGGAALAGGAAAAARGGAALAGGASTAYSLGAAGQSGATGVASGLGGVARAGGSAAVSPLRRAASRAAESMRSSFNAGGKAAFEATGGSSTMGSIGGDAAGDGAASSGAANAGGPPAWAQRMRRSQRMTHAVQATAHAVRSGDAHGGGSSVNLSEGDR